MSRLPLLVQTLLAHGKSADTPAAAVHWATTGDQRTVQATLGELPGAVQAAGLTAPAVLILGSVVALRAQLAWFEHRPLLGKRILVTRPRTQAGEMLRRLEELGAVPLELPVVEIHAPSDWAPVDDALRRLASFDWLVFTSVNGVYGFLRRLRQQGRDLRALGSLRLAAIGPATADALRGYQLEPDLVPDDFCSEGLANALKPHVLGRRVLLARADRGRELLRDELAAIAHVEQVAVYSQVDAVDASSDVFDQLRRGEIDYVTLTSSNIARAFLRALDATSRDRIAAGDVRLVSISPITSTTIREAGLPVAVEASVYTTAGMLEALVRYVEAR
jgi:uroporphyrinogen III methyltransferase/synthase